MAKIGRPTIVTPETIATLEDAFSNGASDREAIFLANISSATFYNYCKEHPDFLERKEALKDMIKYQARLNVKKAISDNDKQVSQWYLERKVKEEFAQRSEVTGKDGKDLIPDEETRNKAHNAIKDFIGGDTTERDTN